MRRRPILILVCLLAGALSPVGSGGAGAQAQDQYASVVEPDSPIAWWRFEGGLSDSSGAGRSAQLGPARGLRERRTGNIHGNAQVHRFRAPRGRGVPPRLCRFAVRNGCEVR